MGCSVTAMFIIDNIQAVVLKVETESKTKTAEHTAVVTRVGEICTDGWNSNKN